jgi:hypothetical protein
VQRKKPKKVCDFSVLTRIRVYHSVCFSG